MVEESAERALSPRASASAPFLRPPLARRALCPGGLRTNTSRPSSRSRRPQLTAGPAQSPQREQSKRRPAPPCASLLCALSLSVSPLMLQEGLRWYESIRWHLQRSGSVQGDIVRSSNPTPRRTCSLSRRSSAAPIRSACQSSSKRWTRSPGSC